MGFDGNKFKVLLKLSINRLKMLQAKKQSLNEGNRREIAGLLERGKTESAMIRVEHIIREDYMLEALEMVELFCEILHARFGLLAGPDVKQKSTCPPDLQEQIATIVYAAPRCECEELVKLKQLLVHRVGKEFIQSAADNQNGEVNPRVLSKLKIAIPSPVLVNAYLAEIARTYKVKWVPPPPPPGNGGLRETIPSVASPAVSHLEDARQHVLESPLLASAPSPQSTSPVASPQASSPSAPPPQFSTMPKNGHTTADTNQGGHPGDVKHQYFTGVNAPYSIGPPPAQPDTTDESDPSLDELQKRLDELKKRG